MAVKFLDSKAAKFQEIECSEKDLFCWWFLFHINIGNPGSSSMQGFAENIKVLPNGKFTGEGHLFQYPAYWLLKGVPPETELSNGESLIEFIESEDWQKNLYLANDKEPSWYLIGERILPSLPRVDTNYSDETACMGSHYLVGLYAQNPDSPLFRLELEKYKELLDEVMQTSPEEALSQPGKADILIHSFETLCLVDQRQIIDAKFFNYNMRFLEAFSRLINRDLRNASSPEQFVNSRSETAYLTAGMLGHFRYGLRVCAGFERNRLRSF